MRTSYHNHTIWSDGTATCAAMCDGARAAQLDEFGLSDHNVRFPDDRQQNWFMPPDFLDTYVAEIRAAMGAAGPVLRLGIEADFFPETAAAVRDLLARHPFDYVIASVHFVAADGGGYFPIDLDAEHWAALSPDGVNAVWRRYWAAIRAMAESGLGDFVGHLDLPKKFGYRPTIDLSAEIAAALDAIAAADMAIELNTAGWQKPIAEAYPSLPLLRAARARDIPLLINADAHAPGDVACAFDRARDLAREAGYTELVHYRDRQRMTAPL